MKYDRVTALTVEAIKELSAKINSREKEMAQMLTEKELQIEDLQDRLSRLESLFEQSKRNASTGE